MQGALEGTFRRVQQRGEVKAGGLPVIDRGARVEYLHAADSLVQRAKAQRREVLTHLLGDEGEEGLHELGPTGEAGAQLRVLGRHAHRAGVEVTHPHHHAPGDHQRRGREAELLRAQQRADDDIPTGLELAVHLDDDPVAQAVEQQRLLSLGQPQLPGCAGVLERGQRGGTGTTVMPGDQDDIGVGLGHSGGHRAHTDLSDELDVHPGPRVGVLQVVDELGEILDGIDVVVRRR